MARKISPARQRNAVSEGFALGLCMLGRYEFPFEKLRIDLAFERAWDDWPARYRSQFPQVNTDLSKGLDAVWVITRADEKHHTSVLFWEWDSPGPIRIYARQQDWDTDNPEDVEFALRVIDGDVPLEGWIELAREFLKDFDREYGQG